MPPPAQSRARRWLRLSYRWLRLLLWTLLALVIVCGLWLNRVGLPDFLKERLVAELRSQGVELEFARMRLRWSRGIVAENVTFERTGSAATPRLYFQMIEINLDYAALWHRHIRVTGLELDGGRMTWPWVDSTERAREVSIERIHGLVRFLPDDRWELTSLEAHAWGADFTFFGTITNAPAVRTWKFGRPQTTPEEREDFWRKLVAQLERVEFKPAARIDAIFSGDALDPRTFSAQLDLDASDFHSPWASGRALQLALSARPESNHHARVEMTLKAGRTRSPWGRVEQIDLQGEADLPFAGLQPENVRTRFAVEAPTTRWGRARHLDGTAEVGSPFSASRAPEGRMELQLQSPDSPWAQADELALTAVISTNVTNATIAHGAYHVRFHGARSAWLNATNGTVTLHALQSATNLWPERTTVEVELQEAVLKAAANPESRTNTTAHAALVRCAADLELPAWTELALGDTNASWASRLETIPGVAEITVATVSASGLNAEHLSAALRWQAPELHLEELRIHAQNSQANAAASLDLVTRELTARLSASLDSQAIAVLPVMKASAWKDFFTSEEPPNIEVEFRAQLPAWTNGPPDWRREVLPTVELDAHIEAGSCSIRAVPCSSVQAALTLTNLAWSVRDLEVTRPEGRLLLELDSDLRTHDFHARATSTIDPESLRPLLDTEAGRKALDRFEFIQPPWLQADVSGRWGTWERLGGRAHAAFTNLAFRGQSVKSCVADVAYTNQVIDVFAVRLEREEGVATVDQIRVDLPRESVSLTNVQSAIEVSAVAHAIGPHVVERLSPYRYASPPTVHFQGTVGIKNKSGLDDARFEVSGGDFQWQNFKFSRAAAELHWLGDTLSLTNFQGRIRHGDVEGSAYFEFSSDEPGTQFRFRLSATNVNAKPLLADLFPASTNRLEGFLSGHLIITNANTADMNSWFGYGDANLREGLIWDEPIFSVFSPLLNKVAPGLGNSRAREARATFIITNSVIVSRDLEVRTSTLRMQFEGTVDFEGHVDGTMEAQLFRNTPGLGWMISRVFWPVTKVFEYKIGGTLGQPQTKPLYIPKILLAPLHPLRTIRELFSDDKEEK